MNPDEVEYPEEPQPRRFSSLGWVAGGVLLAFLGLAGGAFAVARYGQPPTLVPVVITLSPNLSELPPAKLKARADRALRTLARLQPREPYLVVDSYRNRLRLIKNGQVKRDALCSTGTGIVLIDPRNQRKWIFDTPVGERIVERKQKNPVWMKPDWAFIEEGEEPPPPGSPDRVDPYSLGDYGLYLGDGYIIHGTLFKSLLGRRVTHGCIRLGDEDLEFFYHHVPVGTRVYLY